MDNNGNGDLKACVAVNANDIEHIKDGIDKLEQLMNRKFEEGDRRMDDHDRRLGLVEQTLNGSGGVPGLVSDVAWLKEKALKWGAIGVVLLFLLTFFSDSIMRFMGFKS